MDKVLHAIIVEIITVDHPRDNRLRQTLNDSPLRAPREASSDTEAAADPEIAIALVHECRRDQVILHLDIGQHGEEEPISRPQPRNRVDSGEKRRSSGGDRIEHYGGAWSPRLPYALPHPGHLTLRRVGLKGDSIDVIPVDLGEVEPLEEVEPRDHREVLDDAVRQVLSEGRVMPRGDVHGLSALDLVLPPNTSVLTLPHHDLPLHRTNGFPDLLLRELYHPSPVEAEAAHIDDEIHGRLPGGVSQAVIGVDPDGRIIGTLDLVLLDQLRHLLEEGHIPVLPGHHRTRPHPISDLNEANHTPHTNTPANPSDN